jgi:hypothetical protein
MAALSLTSKNVTEFAGDYKVAVVKVTATTSTNDTITISDMGTIVGATATPAAATTAACAQLAITGISANVMTVQAMKAAGAICTETPIAFYVTAIGY